MLQLALHICDAPPLIINGGIFALLSLSLSTARHTTHSAHGNSGTCARATTLVEILHVRETAIRLKLLG